MRHMVLSNRKLRLFVISTMAILLASCANTQTNRAASQADNDSLNIAELTGDFSRSKLIAADFVSTLARLPESKPSETVLHTTKPSSRFGELLLGALQQAGFDLRIGNKQSQRWLAYNANRDETLSDSGNAIFTFIIAAGNIKLKRSYEVDQYGIKPAGSMFVSGATTDNLVMDDSIFSVRSPDVARVVTEEAVVTEAVVTDETNILTDKPFDTVASLEDADVELNAVPTREPLIKFREKAEVNKLTSLQTAVPVKAELVSFKTSAATVTAVASASESSGAYSEFPNMYTTDTSRYADTFTAYENVNKEVYVFPNDSVVLGKQNKLLIQKLAQNFNSATDVVAVLGCSHGASNIENGNAYLATNRAFRVKEEFVLAGLDADKVLEEGCWAGVDNPGFPARGVLVQHKRLKK